MQNLYAWQEPTLTLVNPFVEFLPEVTATYKIGCGAMIYSVEMIPQDPDPLTKDLYVDSTGLTVNIEFDVRKIDVGGLKADFILTGMLQKYYLYHSETFTVKVYTFECTAQAQTYLYKVGDEAIYIPFTIKQAPDTEVIPELSVFSVKKVEGSNRVTSPAFMRL